MAEGTYEFEVMRAELLGIEPPERTVFEESQRERMAAAAAVEEQELVTEQAKVCVLVINIIAQYSNQLQHSTRNWTPRMRRYKVAPGNWTS